MGQRPQLVGSGGGKARTRKSGVAHDLVADGKEDVVYMAEVHVKRLVQILRPKVTAIAQSRCQVVLVAERAGTINIRLGRDRWGRYG